MNATQERETTGTRLSVRLSKEENDILSEYCRRTGRKKAQVIREYIYSLRRD